MAPACRAYSAANAVASPSAAAAASAASEAARSTRRRRAIGEVLGGGHGVHDSRRDDRIELRAGPRAHLLQRGGGGQGWTVRTRARHRIERIAGEDDPRAQRDLLAGERVRVAQAVPSLVVMAHDR